MFISKNLDYEKIIKSNCAEKLSNVDITGSQAQQGLCYLCVYDELMQTHIKNRIRMCVH